jgi:hypothetical protein
MISYDFGMHQAGVVLILVALLLIVVLVLVTPAIGVP